MVPKLWAIPLKGFSPCCGSISGSIGGGSAPHRRRTPWSLAAQRPCSTGWLRLHGDLPARNWPGNVMWPH